MAADVGSVVRMRKKNANLGTKFGKKNSLCCSERESVKVEVGVMVI